MMGDFQKSNGNVTLQQSTPSTSISIDVVRRNEDGDNIDRVSVVSASRLISSPSSGWKGLSSLEKSLSVALGLMSILSLALMIGLIIVGFQLRKDDYEVPQRTTQATQYPPWVTTIGSTTPRPEVTTRERPTTITAAESTTPVPFLCMSDQCEQITNSLNRSVDPCDNFYNFACGAWIKGNPTSHEQPDITQFTRMHESLVHTVKEILGTDNDKKVDNIQLAAVDKAREFYRMCMNDQNDFPLLYKNMRESIEKLMSAVEKTKEGLLSLLAKLKVELDANYIYNIWIEIHLENKEKNAIYLGYPDLEILLELRETLTHSPDVDPNNTAYSKYMEDLWSKVFPEETSSDIITKLIHFEKKLMKVLHENQNNESPVVEILGPNVTEGNYSEAITFAKQVFSLTMSNLNRTIDHNLASELDRIILEPKYYTSISNLLNEDINTTINFLKWRIILDLKRYTEHQYSMQKKRWEVCAEESLRFFGPALIAKYIPLKIKDPSTFKTQVYEMADGLRLSAMEKVKDATWIFSGVTRDFISQKLQNMEIFAVYPPSLTNGNVTAALDYYSTLGLTNVSSHLDNILTLSKWRSLTQMGLAWGTANDTKFRKYLEMQRVNHVSFDHLTNSLYLPTSLFRLPLFSNDINSSTAFNFGSVGNLISEALVEVIQSSAMHYVNGKLAPAWDEITLDNFQNVAHCRKNFYNVDSPTGGSPLINEETTGKVHPLKAGGFKVALSGFRRWKSSSDHSQIQGLESYSPDQQFYIGFAQTWCESLTRERLLEEMTQLSQTPMSLRINGMVENSEEFGKVWSCSKLSKPVSTSTCNLW